MLKKIAQTTQGTPATSGNQQGAQTTPASTTVQPAGPSIDLEAIFSQIDLPAGWDSSRIPYIRRIISSLDRAANASTNGKFNLRNLWPTFPDGAESDFTSPASDVLKLLRKAYQQFLNKGNRYSKQLTSDEVRQRINVLLTAPELNKLTQVNPTGPIGMANISLESIRQDLINMMPPAGAR